MMPPNFIRAPLLFRDSHGNTSEVNSCYQHGNRIDAEFSSILPPDLDISMGDEIAIVIEQPDGEINTMFTGNITGWTIEIDGTTTIRAENYRETFIRGHRHLREMAESARQIQTNINSLWQDNLYEQFVEAVARMQVSIVGQYTPISEAQENAEALFKELFGEVEQDITIQSKINPELHYKIPLDGDSVKLYEEGDLIASYCLDVHDGAPTMDKVIARALLIMHDERRFLESANDLMRHPVLEEPYHWWINNAS